MKSPAFFRRSELTATLWAFRHEFLIVAFFSMVANLLMLTPTLYMLQVYDRVMASQSEVTLVAMSLLTLALFAVMAFAEWMRTRVLVSAGVRLDERLGTQVFNASFEAHLSQSGSSPARSFGDLIQVRQFLTGNGVFAFLDAPWCPIYMVVLYLMHPWLGFLGLIFGLIQAALAWFGHRHTLAPSEAAVAANSEATVFMQSKLRNSEVIESMGMLENLRRRWALRHAASQEQGSAAHAVTHRVIAWSKFVRYTQQSLALGAGALLVINGEITPGAMIASNVPKCRTSSLAVASPTWRMPKPNKKRGRVVCFDFSSASTIFCADFSAMRSNAASAVRPSLYKSGNVRITLASTNCSTSLSPRPSTSTARRWAKCRMACLRWALQNRPPEHLWFISLFSRTTALPQMGHKGGMRKLGT